jgi:hypothetical protein
MGGGGQGEEGLLAAGELEHRWPDHIKSFAHPRPRRLRGGYHT